LLLLAVTISCLNVSWQFLRAWLPLFLQDNQGFSKETTRLATAGYFIASDVGCLLAGVLVGRLVAGGRSVVGACGVGFAAFALLTTAAAAVPLVPAGWLTIGLLWVAGAGILGLHPCYYALTQELPAARVGVLAGGLAAVGWVVSAVFQGFVGTWIKATQSYALGLTLAGLLPLVAVCAVFLLRRK
jgi:ACS family hexuronate transporter-like MFS transporter